MALLPPLLQSRLLELDLTKPPDAQDAARRLAQAYFDYASTAQAGGFPGIFTADRKQRMESTLVGALRASAPFPATFVLAWVAAYTAFWMAPPVVFGPGLVTAPAGAGLLSGQLLAALVTPQPSALAALRIATALDLATRATLVTLPPGNTFPLT